MSAYENLKSRLSQQSHTWLVTGVAGFIGSHLLEELLLLGQTVVGMDNFSTGRQINLDEVEQRVGPEAWQRFTLHRKDIRHPEDCSAVVAGVDYVLHQAALGSVPRSIDDPLTSHESNINGFLNMLIAARDANVKRFVYAASSSTYGDHPGLPKVEDVIGKPLSPYAVTKYVNELYADVFARTYGLEAIGLRYFNVFGPRQDPQGAYAAVIPRWCAQLFEAQACRINGDGETSRDFCFVKNAVQMNLLAATTQNEAAINQIYNVALGDRTSLNELYQGLKKRIMPYTPALAGVEPEYADFRGGDVRHSQADISKAKSLLGYEPSHRIDAGLEETVLWFAAQQLQSNV